jgi:hypothetical protein
MNIASSRGDIADPPAPMERFLFLANIGSSSFLWEKLTTPCCNKGHKRCQSLTNPTPMSRGSLPCGPAAAVEKALLFFLGTQYLLQTIS